MPNELTRVHPSMMKDAFFFNTFLIGAIIPVMATSTYVPFGCLYCDANEYSRASFTEFYDNYLATGKLLTCTYGEYATQVALTGNCGKFALDTVNGKFKVPLLKDGDSITQAASAAELGKSYKAGLPNATGQFTDAQFVAPYSASGVFQGGAPTGSITAPAAGGTQGTVVTTLSLQRANAIYGNSTTVTDEQVRLRHFVVVANAQNNASVFNWSNYLTALTGKANVTLDNISTSGQTAIRNIAVQSGRRGGTYVSGVFPATLAAVTNYYYTPPADGKLYIYKDNHGAPVALYLCDVNDNVSPLDYCAVESTGGVAIILQASVKAGVQYRLVSTQGVGGLTSRFYYPEGV